MDYEKLAGNTLGETSASVRARVEAARERQQSASQGRASRPLYCNADMGPAEVRQFCDLDQAGRGLIKAAMQQLGLSARAYHRVLKLARTIADLAGSEAFEARTWRRRCSIGRGSAI